MTIVSDMATRFCNMCPYTAISRDLSEHSVARIRLMSSRIATVQRHISMSCYKSPVTSHILDTSLGRPAAHVRVELQHLQDNVWVRVNEGQTDADGRVARHLVPEVSVFEAGIYRIVFDTAQYFKANGVTEFLYPEVTITFNVKDPTQHYHIPLLLNPFGYSTYRGS